MIPGHAQWLRLQGEETKRWARIWGTAWTTSLRVLLPAGKDAMRRAISQGLTGKGINIHSWASSLKPFGTLDVRAADILRDLQKSKLRITVAYLQKTPTIIVHKSPWVQPPAGTLKGVNWSPFPFEMHKVPYLSTALENQTGLSWMFEPDALDQHEVARLFRVSRKALEVPEIREKVGDLVKDLPKGPSPLKVEPHFPVRLPQFAGVAHAFKAGRPVGWAAVGASALDVFSVLSFASFLKGNNPGFLAQVLWKSPAVALPLGIIVNAIWGRKRRREYRKKMEAARAEAERQAQAEFARQVEEYRATLHKRTVRRAQRSVLTARAVQALRYGTYPQR